MKFSIIVPTFNRAYIIEKLIRSVKSQTYTNWELLVVDDGSTDNTKSVIKSFKDNKIKYFYKKNGGPSSARNLGLNKSTGDWIIYIDSDNELLTNYLDILRLNIINKPNKLFFITKVIRTIELYEKGVLVDIIDDSNNYPEKLSVQDIYTRRLRFDINGFAHSREIYTKGYKWDCNIFILEDWDFFMQFADKYIENFGYIKIPAVNYHQRFGTDGLVSNSSYKDWAESFEYLWQKHKSSALMKGQTWYPSRVKKYIKLHAEHKKSKARPPYLIYFPNFKKTNSLKKNKVV